MARLVVGLGNPGKAYEKSKHNVGFICLDKYVKQAKLKFKKEPKFQSEIIMVGKNILLKPKTFMNLSGNAVRSIVEYYNIEAQNIMIISDDLDLSFSKIRLREKGSAGGHNGLKSIIENLGTNSIKRCKIGIGRDEDTSAKDYVLSSFSKTELKIMDDISITISNVIDDFFNETSFQEMMNKYNGIE
ncbi:MAG: aminoacyl-tRNA hydrolase [Firmicutes bacterium]|nr:aminoacyl-tRNA hydrolase [Bacillota bacterium]